MTRTQRKILAWMHDQYGPVIWYDGATASKRTREKLTDQGLIRQVYSRRGNFTFEVTPQGAQQLEGHAR